MYLTQSNYYLFNGGLIYLPNFQGSFPERGQAKHTVLLSNISHIDHQASYTPDYITVHRNDDSGAMDILII